jgi:hypothetical protein
MGIARFAYGRHWVGQTNQMMAQQSFFHILFAATFESTEINFTASANKKCPPLKAGGQHHACDPEGTEFKPYFG